MSFMFDIDGFYRIELFLYVSIALLYVVYKKGYKYILLPIIPLLLIPYYQNYMVAELLSRKQSSFVHSQFNEVYQLHVSQTDHLKKDHLYDYWDILTDNGEYTIRFNTGTSKGFEIYEIAEESESLIARQNVIDVLNTINVKGFIVFIDRSEYEVIDGEDTYIVRVNNKGRVDEVIDKKENKLFKNEENLNPVDGSVLHEEDFG